MIDNINTQLTIRDKTYQVNWNLQQVNILVGDNGSGKTRLLEQISYCTDSTILNLPFELFVNPDDILFSDGKLPLNLIDLYEKLTDEWISSNFKSSDYKLLSKGRKYLIDLLSSIYYCYPNSTVLIDDVGQNLDLGTQQKLLDFLVEQRPDLQFIVTTHSPSIFGKNFGNNVTFINNILTEIL